jgi:hypothetical protein
MGKASGTRGGKPTGKETSMKTYTQAEDKCKVHHGNQTVSKLVYRVRQKDVPYLERALCELWWGYGGGGSIDR